MSATAKSSGCGRNPRGCCLDFRLIAIIDDMPTTWKVVGDDEAQPMATVCAYSGALLVSRARRCPSAGGGRQSDPGYVPTPDRAMANGDCDPP